VKFQKEIFMTKITVICENSVQIPFPVIGEHGLSFFIEREEGNTLFDTGQGLGVVHNLKLLGKDINSIKRVILSHGHYDHTGGLLSILKERKETLPVYLHPDAFLTKCAKLPNGMERAIGFPHDKSLYEENGAEFIETNGFEKIADGMFTISNIHHSEGWRPWDKLLMIKNNDDIAPDPFSDDLSLLLETSSSPVVLLGCAHSGIVEILDELSSKSNHSEFFAVIGGTHLDSAPEDYVEKTLQSLKKYNVQKIAVSHCTGLRIAHRLANIFGEKFSDASVGRIFEF